MQLLGYAPRVYPGVVELVRALRGKARLAVVSGTWRENIQAVLDAAGLAGDFDMIVGKEDVTARKPDPEAYPWRSRSSGCRRKSAVAIEDSPSGLSAARDAGIRGSPSAIAAPSATGSATRPMSRASSRRGVLEQLGFWEVDDRP